MKEMMTRRQRIWQSSRYQRHDMKTTLLVSTAVFTVQPPTLLLVPEQLL